jgi:hypothetical protein
LLLASAAGLPGSLPARQPGQRLRAGRRAQGKSTHTYNDVERWLGIADRTVQIRHEHQKYVGKHQEQLTFSSTLVPQVPVRDPHCSPEQQRKQQPQPAQHRLAAPPTQHKRGERQRGRMRAQQSTLHTHTTHARTHARTHTAHAHTRTHTHTHTHTPTPTPTHTNAHARPHTHARTRKRTHTRIHALHAAARVVTRLSVGAPACRP